VIKLKQESLFNPRTYNVIYELRNMKGGSIKIYITGGSEYIGDLEVTATPTSLVNTEDELIR